MGTDQTLEPGAPPGAGGDQLGWRRLGLSDVSVTRVVLGGAPLGGLFGPVSDEAARSTLEAAWNAGVRAFDTAPHYGVGLAETRLGSFVSTRSRAEVIISTKVGRLLVVSDDDVEGAEGFYGTPKLRRVRDYSRAGVRRSIQESCSRLGIDRLDIALVHDPDDHFAEAISEALPALCDLRAEGTVGAIGVGMNQAGMLVRFVREAELDCVLVAGRWSLLDRSAGEELLPLCMERQVGVLVGGVFNSGILADARPGALYDYSPAGPELFAAARRLREICTRYGVPLRVAALHFPLRHPAVSAIVVGARSPDEVITDLADLDRTVPDELWAELAAG
jgi:aryl-alcohol dehydrogenase-like predicted oxidoreductase